MRTKGLCDPGRHRHRRQCVRPLDSREVPGKTSASEGWGETSRLKVLPPVNAILAARKRWRGAPDNDALTRAIADGDIDRIRSLSVPAARLTASLHLAVRANRLDIVRAMLDLGAKVDGGTTSGKCTVQGQTALTRAVAVGYHDVVELLLEHGANPDIARTDGATPLEIARSKGDREMMELIERHSRK